MRPAQRRWRTRTSSWAAASWSSCSSGPGGGCETPPGSGGTWHPCPADTSFSQPRLTLQSNVTHYIVASTTGAGISPTSCLHAHIQHLHQLPMDAANPQAAYLTCNDTSIVKRLHYRPAQAPTLRLASRCLRMDTAFLIRWYRSSGISGARPAGSERRETAAGGSQRRQMVVHHKQDAPAIKTEQHLRSGLEQSVPADPQGVRPSNTCC